MAKKSIRGAVVAITGGARGIGLATAQALRAQGAHVSIGDIDAQLAAQAAARVGAYSAELDVRDKASFSRFLESTHSALGPVDVLINNAGIMPMGPFVDEADAISDAQIDINLRGVIHGMKLVLPEMIARGSGHIVNVASLAGRFPIPGASVYCGTKFAVCGMSEALRGELRNTGVNVSVVLPSRVSTELSTGTAAGNGVPTVTPEDVAQAVLDAIQYQLPEVSAPGYLRPVSRYFNVLPRWLEDAARRVVKDDRIMTRLDRVARAPYEQRLSTLVSQPRSAKGANQ
ncbi:Short-chain dehydrogenase [gamma proteobacterium HdN1]|nr:Short-chain dehydrogenase [gamma proteobacterium HdN1]